MNIEHKILLVKLTLYYASICGALAILAMYYPYVLDYMPFGGLSEIFNNSIDYSNFQDEVIATYKPINDFQGAIQLTMALVGTILVMLPTRWVYFSSSSGSDRQGIAANLILLPLIVTGIVAIVQNSLALAFSLAGIVAGVSYRTRLKNSTDALYIFFAIGVGLAAGTQSMGIALVMSVFFTYSVVLISPPRVEITTPKDSAKDTASQVRQD